LWDEAMTISCGEFRLRYVQKIRSASYAGFAMGAAKLSAAVELIIAHRIHFPGAAIQSTFTSLTLGSICVAARRLVMRYEPRGADVTIRHFEGGFR